MSELIIGVHSVFESGIIYATSDEWPKIYRKIEETNSVFIRDIIEPNENVRLLATYVVFVKKDKVLTYRRGRSDDRLKKARSIGFGGHVRSLESPLGAAKREVAVEINLFTGEYDIPERPNLIISDTTQIDRCHLGLQWFGTLFADIDDMIISNEIGDLRLETINDLYENIEMYESWSRLLIRELYEDNEGKIR